MAEMIGSCLCGKVRFSVDAEPAFVGLCHCRNCQKQVGAPYAAVVGVPSAALSVDGELSTYTLTADSGNTTEHRFCPVCGSPIVWEAAVMPGISMIHVGTLDDPHAVKPVMQIFCDSALDWAKLEGVQDFPRMPG